MGAIEKIEEKMKTLHVADSLDEIWAVVNRANKYIDETTPWILAKNEADRPRLGTVLYNLVETIRIIAALLSSYIPETSKNIAAQINAAALDYESVHTFGLTKAGEKVGKAEPLFARIDIEKTLKEIAFDLPAPEQNEEAVADPEHKPEIGIEEFAAAELRVGKVLECEKVKKSKKLLKLQIDLGYEKRQVVSGIANYYKPEEMVGKRVVVVVNLKSVTLCGEESHGMILCASEGDKLTVVTPETDIPLGSEVR